MRMRAFSPVEVSLQDFEQLMSVGVWTDDHVTVTVGDVELKVDFPSAGVQASAEVASRAQFETACAQLEALVRELLPQDLPESVFDFGKPRADTTVPLTPEVANRMWMHTHPDSAVAEQPRMWNIKYEVDEMFSVRWKSGAPELMLALYPGDGVNLTDEDMVARGNEIVAQYTGHE